MYESGGECKTLLVRKSVWSIKCPEDIRVTRLCAKYVMSESSHVTCKVAAFATLSRDGFLFLFLLDQGQAPL